MSDRETEHRAIPLVRSLRRTDRGPFGLPASSGNFVGRERELETLIEALRGGGRHSIAGLRGMGGIGKTSLAIEAARRLAPEFADGVLFITLTDDSIETLIAEVVRTFAPTARVPADRLLLTEMYRYVLAGKKLLLILDDVEDRKQVEWLALPEPATMLVISRRDLDLLGSLTLELSELSPLEAVNLLRTNIGSERILDSHDLEVIASACGCHPLTLTLAGAIFRQQPTLSASQFVEEMKIGSAARPKVTVRAALESALNQLNDQDPETARRIALLVVFPSSFSQRAAAAVWQVDENSANVTLSLLRAQGFLQIDADDRFVQHELVREFIKQERVIDLDEACLLHARHYLEVLAVVAEEYRRAHSFSAALKSFKIELPNIEAAQLWAENNAGTSAEAARITVAYANTATDVIGLLLPPPRWTDWLKAAIDASRTLNDPIGEAYALGNVGVAHLKQGDAVQAMPHLEHCITLSQKLNDISLEARALGSLGLAHSLIGNVQQAISYYERNLTLARKIQDRPAEAAAIGNLGLAYASIGDMQHAIEFLELQMVMSQESGDRFAEANATGNLGLCNMSLGDPSRAIQLFKQQLAIAKEIGDRRGEASAQSNFGSALFSTGDLEPATNAYEEALIVSRHLGDRLQEAKLLGNLGNVYLAANQADAALDAYAQQIEIARAIGDARGEGNALWNSALALEAIGDKPAAIDRAKLALALRQQTRDPSAVRVADWLRKRGMELSPG